MQHPHWITETISLKQPTKETCRTDPETSHRSTTGSPWRRHCDELCNTSAHRAGGWQRGQIIDPTYKFLFPNRNPEQARFTEPPPCNSQNSTVSAVTAESQTPEHSFVDAARGHSFFAFVKVCYQSAIAHIRWKVRTARIFTALCATEIPKRLSNTMDAVMWIQSKKYKKVTSLGIWDSGFKL